MHATTKFYYSAFYSKHQMPPTTRHVTFQIPKQTRKSLFTPSKLATAHSAPGDMDEETVSLATLLSFLDGDAGIPSSMLVRAGRPLRMWSSEGEPGELSPLESGLDPDLLITLESNDRLTKALDQLHLTNLINVHEGVIRMHAGSRAMYKHCGADPDHWMLQAVLVVCHAFPRFEYLESEFGAEGRAQIRQVQHILQHYDALEERGRITDSTKLSMAAMLLASSKFCGVRWKSRTLERVQILLTEVSNIHLEMWFTAQRGDLARLTNDSVDWKSMSDSVLAPGKDKLLNALSGEIALADVGGYLRVNEDVETAFAILDQIQPLDRSNISSFEEIVLQRKAFAVGRLLRFEGRFEEARHVLSALYHAGPYPVGTSSFITQSCDLVSHLAAVLCELGEPFEAEKLLSEKLNSMTETESHRVENVQRLKLSLAEAILQQGEYWRAQDLYLDLVNRILSHPIRPESFLSMARLRMGLARVQHEQGNWPAALKLWERALKEVEGMGWEDGFAAVIILSSISAVHYELGNIEQGAAYRDKAQKMSKIVDRRYWFTGGRKWLGEVLPSGA